MSDCCMSCFNDKIIKDFIVLRAAGSSVSRCSFCGTEDAIKIDSKLLYVFIEKILVVLTEHPAGLPLKDILKNEFCLFNGNITQLEMLLADILEGRYDSSLRYTVNSSGRPTSDWFSFKDEIVSKNRYFPQTPIYKDIFSKKDGDPTFFTLIETLEVKYSQGDSLYRARVSEKILTVNEMGMPPADRVTFGRANPAGIPYLYLAKNELTCIAEVRPSNGAKVCLATFKPKKDLKLLDLTNPRKKASFLVLEEDELLKALDYVALLEAFSHDLSLPVLPEKGYLNYIPTQFICEFFKTVCEFEGIIFKSSFGFGDNVVLFDEVHVRPDSLVNHYIVSGITPEFSLI